MGGGQKEKKKDEVEQLLEAAQDEVMLKLSIDSHMSRVSPDYLSSDLHNRFLALRSRPSIAPPPPPPPPQHQPRSNAAEDSYDQLFARFAALKASLPAAASASSSQSTPRVGPTASMAETSSVDVDGEEDEVDKVIKWAMDAARLDPSPPSDDDDHDGDDHDDRSSDDENDDDDDGDGDHPRKDGNRSRRHG